MTDSSNKSESPAAEGETPRVKRLSDVPVFNCHVYVSPADGAGVLRARVANLPEVVAEGQTQREVLQKIVSQFKTTVARYMGSGDAIPWTVPSLPRDPAEQEYWIAVHL